MGSEAFLPLLEVPTRSPGERLALIHGSERWTWRRLADRAQQWAALLLDAGVRPDDLVAFAMPNGPEFFALTFGTYGAGATPAPLSPKMPPAEMKAVLELMNPASAVGDHSAMPDALPFPADSAPGTSSNGHVAASWKACTSGGSTGRPKVIVDGRPAGFPQGSDFIGIPAGTVLVPGPLYHNAPFSAAVFALWKGATVVTMPRFDASEALALIERERVEWALMVPTMLQRILRLGATPRDLSSWRQVVHTAAPMPGFAKREWIERFGPDHIWEVYGATEGLVRTSIGGREWLERPGSVGRPIGGARIRILDDAMRDLPPGQPGEVYAMPATGPGSTYRYVGAARRSTADGWESVGDVGHVDEEGYLYLADRRSDLIISGGVNIWPAEVEGALARHPAILSCAVVGVPDPDLGEHVHAIVETSDPDLDLEAVRRFVRDMLSPEKAPRSLALSEGPVRDDAGKVRRAALVDTYGGRDGVTA